MSQVKLCLFGFPQLLVDGQPVDLNRRKEAALLIYLAVTGKPHSRETLANLFWPGYPDASALGNLRRTLFGLRKTVPADWLAAERAVLAFTPPAGYACDVVDLRNLVAAVRSHAHGSSESCAECLNHLRTAVTLCSGDFLAGFSLPDCPDFDAWQTVEGEILRQESIYVLEELALAEARQKNYSFAIERWKRLLRIDPLHEKAQQQILRLLVWMGQRDAALRQYETYAAQLRDELAIQPSAQMVELANQIRRGSLLPPPETKFSTPALASLPLPPETFHTPPAIHTPETSPLQALGLLQRRKQAHFFRIIDVDQDGQIGWPDFARYLQRAEMLAGWGRESPILSRAEEDLRSWWQALIAPHIKQRGEGSETEARLVLNDWLNFWGALTVVIAGEAAEGGRAALHSMEESARIHFQLFDSDQDTLFSALDYANWMAAWGVQGDVGSNFRRLDQDRDGFLRRQEIVGYLREFHLSNDPEAVGNYLYGPFWNTSAQSQRPNGSPNHHQPTATDR